jgi:peptide deformylase
MLRILTAFPPRFYTELPRTDMSTLEILTFPDPRLRSHAERVKPVDDDVRRIVDDMFETMYAAPGIGLAATQVNIPKRIIVIDISEEKDRPLCLINPEIMESNGEEEMEEGCLSVPGFYEPVTRAERVRVRALDRDGKPFELEADGLLAVCIQHEIDHLDGKLFVDYVSALKRQRIRKKLEKEKRQQGPSVTETRRRAI